MHGFEYVDFDDIDYVIGNPHVASGLTTQNIAWAFSGTAAGYWFPLTWLSHMIDVSLFGLDSGPQHLMNVALHATSTVLLFWLFARLTGSLWRSALVAFLFGLHPLHVESVAWIAERKDVLSGLFFVLTLWAYAAYAAKPSLRRYVWVAVAFSCGLMAKPMLVTVPLVLLLFDVWPLRRSLTAQTAAEKLPLLALSGAASLMTFLTQRSAGAMSNLQAIPLTDRVSNAIVSYGAYIGQTFWPVGLSAFYPRQPNEVVSAAIVGALLILGLAAAFRLRSHHPYVLAGYLWFLITLLPVSGLIQVGLQARADRFMYIPQIGLAFALVWSVEALVARWPRSRIPTIACTVAACLVLTGLTWKQVGYWRNTTTLFEHALAVTPDNPVAHNGLGLALRNSGRTEEAIAHYREAIRLWPWFDEAQTNLGEALLATDRVPEAVLHLQAAVAANPNSPEARLNLGTALHRLGRNAEAAASYQAALELRPAHGPTHMGLALALADQGLPDRAAAEAITAARLAPNDADVRAAAAALLAKLGRSDEGAQVLGQAALAAQASARAHADRGNLLARQGKFEDAAAEFLAATKLDPNDAKTHANLGAALASLGRFDDAIAQFNAALRLNPDLPEVRRNLELARELKRGK